jgi:hypothetical protein
MITQITGKKILIAIGIGAILFFAGKYSKPAEVVEKKVIDEQLTQQRIRELEQAYRLSQKNIVTTTVIKSKDGSEETITKVDKSQTEEKNSTEIDSNKTQKLVHSEETKTTINDMLPNYFLHLNYDVLQVGSTFQYQALGLGLDYRLFGTFYATSEFTLQPSVRLGFSLGL